MNSTTLTPTWQNFINFLDTDFRDGELTIRVVGGQPIKVVGGKRDIRFDKERISPHRPDPLQP